MCLPGEERAGRGHGSGEGGRLGGLAHQAGQGGQGVEGIARVEQGFGP